MLTNQSKKAKIIAIYNNKGGVGKTTFAVNFLHSITKEIAKEDGRTYKVLYVDNDGQANGSLILTGLTEDQISKKFENTIFNLMTDEDVKNKECIVKSKIENIDLIPSTDDHNDTPDLISSAIDNTRILKEKLSEVILDYDYIVIDCAPTRDRNVFNALFAADVVVTPMEAQLFSQVGLNNLLKQITRVNKRRETPLLHYVFLSKVDNRQKVHNIEVANKLEKLLFDDFIKNNISLLSLYSKSFESPNGTFTAIDYEDDRGKLEITNLTRNILKKIANEAL